MMLEFTCLAVVLGAGFSRLACLIYILNTSLDLIFNNSKTEYRNQSYMSVYRTKTKLKWILNYIGSQKIIEVILRSTFTLYHSKCLSCYVLLP